MLWSVMQAGILPHPPLPSSQLAPLWELPSAKKSHSTFRPGTVTVEDRTMGTHPDRLPCLKAGLLCGLPSSGAPPQDCSTFQSRPLLNPISSIFPTGEPHNTLQQMTTYKSPSQSLFLRATDLSQPLRSRFEKQSY